jgi:hypothetical protein
MSDKSDDDDEPLTDEPLTPEVAHRLAQQELLRRCAALLDEAKAADDPAPLLDEGNKLLFSALLCTVLDTDGVDALVEAHPNGLQIVPDDEFRRAFTQPTASERDGAAHAARLLTREAIEFLEAKQIDIPWSFDEAEAAWAARDAKAAG